MESLGMASQQGQMMTLRSNMLPVQLPKLFFLHLRQERRVIPQSTVHKLGQSSKTNNPMPR